MQKTKSVANVDRHELENAFNEFNAFAEQLTETYQDLDSQIQQLNKELSDERDRRHQQLAEKERYANRLSLLLSALPAGVIVIDSRGKIQQCNPKPCGWKTYRGRN